MSAALRIPLALLTWPLGLLVLTYQSARLALAQVWANKLRSVLTTLGIIIGVGSVTTVIAALTGMKTFVLDEFESFGTNKIFLGPEWPDTGRHAHGSWRIIRFRPEQFDGWKKDCPSVAALSRIRELGGTIRHNEKTVENVTITGIEPDWHVIENRKVVQGRTFSQTDQDEARQVCIISTVLRDKLQLDKDCTGQSILIDNHRFIVIGLLEPRAQSAMFRDSASEAEAFIPFSSAWKLDDGWMYAMAACKSAPVASDARAELRFLLRRSRGLLPEDPDTFRIEVMQDYLQDFKKVSGAITTVAGGVVGISLLVGGIGIMNIMLVSVSERTREIGLRKAVGARPSAILFQFLVEAIILCLIGGFVGLGLGQGLTLALASIPDSGLEKAFIPIWAMIMAFGFSASVGLIFGMFPAIKASRLDPIEALRHE